MKKGFTLAEVLITLGIIGIVAALTIPNLMANARNKALESQFKKAYSIIQQGLLTVSSNTGVTVNSENFPTPLSFLDEFRAAFIQLEACNKTKCDPNYTMEKVGENYKTYTNKTIYSGYFDDTLTIISDGMHIYTNGDYQSYGITITVDINGINKKPNKWGQDVFSFQLSQDGRLLPIGSEGTTFLALPRTPEEFCDKKSSSAYNGVTCSYYALNDPDFFKNLPK